MTWLVPFEELTVEQIRAIEFGLDEHRVVLGGPGSGKTQILLHRARYLMDHYHIQPDHFRIFVFTNTLKDYIRSALDMLDLPASCVMTFDSWCKSIHQTYVSTNLPKKEGFPDFQAIRQEVLQAMRTKQRQPGLFSQDPAGLSRFDFALVDEGQDLDRVSFEILTLAAKHVTVCMDHKQQIYDTGSEEADVIEVLGLRKRNLVLLGAFRACPYIMKLAATLIDHPEESAHFLQQAKTLQTERTTPLLYLASDWEDERAHLIEMLRLRMARNERIAILLPQTRQVFGFAKGLREANIPVETNDQLDFDSSNPKVLSYHGAKGLTFDSVFLPRLVDRSFPHASEERIAKVLFVGITRAVRWAYLTAPEKGRLALLRHFDPLVKEGVITLQTYRDQPVFEATATVQPAAEDIRELF